MDNVFERHRHHTGVKLKERPSDYFRRQVGGTFIEDPVGVRERHTIGLDVIMWSSDYPHSDSTWPHSRKAIEEHFVGVPEAERRKIVAGNAAALYGLG
jgi:predicted TIM-barrel fold metal-dependent hydrolase